MLTDEQRVKYDKRNRRLLAAARAGVPYPPFAVCSHAHARITTRQFAFVSAADAPVVLWTYENGVACAT